MPTATVSTFPATLSHDEIVHLYCRMQDSTAVSLLAQKQSPFHQIAPLLVNSLCIAGHNKIIVDLHNSTLIVGLRAPFQTTRGVLESCGKVLKRVYFNNVRDSFEERYRVFAELLAEYLTPQIALEFEHCRNLPLVDVFTAEFKQAGAKSLICDS